MRSEMAVGIDLRDDMTQISYSLKGASDVRSFSLNGDDERFAVPTVAVRYLEGTNWLFGLDALEAASSSGCTLMGSLLSAAIDDDGGEQESTALIMLRRFLMYVCSLPAMQEDAEVISTVITIPMSSLKASRVVSKAVAGIMEFGRCMVISYAEALFNYSINQDIGLWKNGVLLFDYRENSFEGRMLDFNLEGMPVVAFTACSAYPEMLPFNEREQEKTDWKLLEILKEILKDRRISCVYLTGQPFEGGWARETVRCIISRNSRVFAGQNLYAKGACYAAVSGALWNHLNERFLFMDDDTLKVNVFIRAINAGKEEEIPLIRAGVSWYNAQCSIQLLAGQDREAVIVLRSYASTLERNVILRMDWLPERPERASRIRLDLEFESISALRVTITDMGFGGVFPSSGKSGCETINIYDED